MSALKKIEERHKPCGCGQGGFAHDCHCSCGQVPCDVVKLARALDALLDTYGPMKPSPETEWAEAERTLKEVAGDK